MIAQSVAEIVSHHVRLTVEGIDRMYLNVFVPGAAVRKRDRPVFPGTSRPTAAVGRVDEPDDATVRGAIGRLCIRGKFRWCSSAKDSARTR